MRKIFSKERPQDERYWLRRPPDDRRMDWNKASNNWIEDYWASRKHPHRKLIIDSFKLIQAFSQPDIFNTVLEVGCSVGPNLSVLLDTFSHLREELLTGIDVNYEVIRQAQDYLPGANFSVRSITDKLPYPDKSFDVVLSDAVLIYIDPKKIRQSVKEISRVAKMGIILVEWDDDKSVSGVIKDFHWCRDYSKILRKLGWSVTKQKISSTIWPAKGWARHGYIYTLVPR